MDEQTSYKRVTLENRLIDFAINIKTLISSLPNDEFTRNLKAQVSRSSTSPAFNYGEAQSAETRRDFIHKMRICLKELRETHVGLKFVKRGDYNVSAELLVCLLEENNQLISIFMASIRTAQRNTLPKS